LRSTAEAVAAALGLPPTQWSIAWQSAGRTPEPWLGPDILEVIDDVAASGSAHGVLASAVGFVADHLEVLFDLDIEAAHRAAEHGLAFARTACVNDNPTVMAALATRVIATA
jgi:protoporphyrin/coproporphyrin ferrochelatase